MILTRDNLLRFIKEQKYVTPTLISEKFETSTMIASAALSDLAKEKLIAITYLKLASSPYYYDPKQKESLVDLGEKHFSSYDKEVFFKLKEEEILNHNTLSIQHALAIERIKDFAKELLIDYQGRELRFWIWYLRDITQTKQQIVEALKGNSNSKTTVSSTKKEEELDDKTTKITTNATSKEIDSKKEPKEEKPSEVTPPKETSTQQRELSSFESKDFSPNPEDNYESKVERFISEFFSKHYLKLETLTKEEKGIFYSCKLKVRNIEIIFDCYYFPKKIQDADLIKFYTSSQNPKIVFLENVPKKLEKLSENLENLTIVNI